VVQEVAVIQFAGHQVQEEQQAHVEQVELVVEAPEVHVDQEELPIEVVAAVLVNLADVLSLVVQESLLQKN
tara:strand:- start:113 stop:325 length:213 start_codon:yes stop_codon:yes gene_type:complete